MREGPPRRAFFVSRVALRALQARDVDRLRALVALLLLVGDTRSLRQRAVPVRVDAAVMDEQVAVALVRRDEAEPLVVAEPLDGPCGHAQPVLRCSSPPTAAGPDGAQPTKSATPRRLRPVNGSGRRHSGRA